MTADRLVAEGPDTAHERAPSWRPHLGRWAQPPRRPRTTGTDAPFCLCRHTESKCPPAPRWSITRTGQSLLEAKPC